VHEPGDAGIDSGHHRRRGDRVDVHLDAGFSRLVDNGFENFDFGLR